MSPRHSRRSVSRNPQQHAASLGETVDETWHRAHSAGRLDIPLSVVAALALLGRRDPKEPDPAEHLRHLSPGDFAGLVRQVWTEVVNARPDLLPALYPLITWWFDEPDQPGCAAAHQTAIAALRGGQLELTGTDSRHDVDLLGIVLSLLKSRSAKGARGQFYTPAPVAAAMAGLLAPEEGQSVSDPTVGTGGLFRAMAEAMRAADRDPTTIIWAGCDVDELAVAAAAVNSLLWNLGPHVLLYVGNTLAEQDWINQARAQRREVMKLAESTRQSKRMLAAMQRLTGSDMPGAEAADSS